MEIVRRHEKSIIPFFVGYLAAGQKSEDIGGYIIDLRRVGGEIVVVTTWGSTVSNFESLDEAEQYILSRAKSRIEIWRK